MLQLDPQAAAYFASLPREVQLGFEASNLTFHTVDDLKDYQARNLSHLGGVLYARLPEPAVPSNGTMDPQDSQTP